MVLVYALSVFMVADVVQRRRCYVFVYVFDVRICVRIVFGMLQMY